jgi:hypothetical protein
MNSHPRIIAVTLLVPTLLFSGVSLSFGQSEKVIEAHEQVLESIEKIDGATEEKKFEIKKESTDKILDLSKLEVADLIESIGEVNDEGIEIVLLQNQIIEDLTVFLEILSTHKVTLEEITKLEALQGLAKDFGQWRKEVYNPTIQIAVDFLLVARAEHALSITEGRFKKITRGLQKIRPAQEMLEILDKLLQSAAEDIKRAGTLHENAKEMLYAYIHEEKSEIMEEDELIAEEKILTDLLEDQEEIASIQDIIEGALGNMKSAYEKFITIARTVTGKE